MKYIIDLPDAYTSKSALLGDILSIPICLESGKRYGIPTGIKLEPYTEPDEDEIRQMAHEEAWDFAMKCLSMDGSEFCDVFDSCDALCLTNLSYQESKTKYDEWKKEKEQIRVGDEVIIKSDGVKGVVLDEDLWGDFSVFTENGCCEAYRKIHFEKTGRHFPEVAELLKKMREE